jgi:predicted enzyme related to lactoylglutathione lyase
MATSANCNPGSFCWLTLVTPDMTSATRFYTGLFSWTEVELVSGFTALMNEGKLLASVVDRGSDERARGQPPNWLPFVRVVSIDASIRRSGELGGKVYARPFDTPGARVALIQGPTHELLGLWETPIRDGPTMVADTDIMGWFELVTPDPSRAIRFYEGLFGWRFTDEGSYTVLTNKSEPVGGVVELQGDWEDHAFLAAIGQAPGEKWDVPPHWMTFFLVDDCDTVSRNAEALGARMSGRPDTLHTFGEFAVIRDPQGAYFSVLSRS